MQRLAGWLGCLVVAAGVSSCGTQSSTQKPKVAIEDNEFGPTGIPPELRRPEPAGTVVTPGGNKRTAAGMRTPIEDIVFTKVDSPDEQLPELADLLAAPKAKIWEESETIARRRSAREGKPLLIWFTSSKFSPLCKALEQELFSRDDFGVWATEKLVRLRVDDAYVVPKDSDISIDDGETLKIDARHYAEALKKRYKVLGHPTLVLLNCSGEVVGRYAGYKHGTADFLWGQLKHAESVATRTYTSWRSGMEKRGYRMWQDRIGRKVFAKPDSYADGELILIDPDGSRFRTHDDKLSEPDRKWLEEQKQLREAP